VVALSRETFGMARTPFVVDGRSVGSRPPGSHGAFAPSFERLLLRDLERDGRRVAERAARPVNGEGRRAGLGGVRHLDRELVACGNLI
jgi:hypothetical protein